MKKHLRRCKNCQCLFEVCRKVKHHEYCKKKECQKARKRKWHKQKLQKDRQYREDQKDAQAIWRQKNPGYWKEYRHKNKRYTKRNRAKQRVRNQKRRSKPFSKLDLSMIAKMDALNQKNHTFSGRYEIIPFMPEKIAKMDAIIVEINPISSGYT